MDAIGRFRTGPETALHCLGRFEPRNESTAVTKNTRAIPRESDLAGIGMEAERK